MSLSSKPALRLSSLQWPAPRLPTPRLAWAAPLVLALAAGLTACGGGSDGGTTAGTATGGTSGSTTGGTAAAAKVQLTGVAATGAAIAGSTVTATNAKGVQGTGITAADGSFTVSIEDAAPYVLSIADASGKVWYSYAAQAGRANITPLTTLALLEANASKPLADLAKAWGSATLTDSQVLAAAAKVNANLKPLMTAQGLDPNTTNVFTSAFSANHTGLDAVLDAMRLNLSCSASACTQTITNPAGSVLVSWNGNIATTGISLSWTASSAGGTTGSGTTGSGTVTVGLGSCKAPKAGTYSLVVQTSVAGLAGVTVPEVCVDGLPGKPASQTDFCGDAQFTAQLPPGVAIQSCSYSGNQGQITAQVSSPIVLTYTVTYTFVLN